MSLSTDFSHDSSSEEEDEGPMGPHTPDIFNNDTHEMTTSYTHVPTPLPSHEVSEESWFRLPISTTTFPKQQDEARKTFKWLVPEHLPNSWLCPLHPKYRGPSRGLCYWHGRRSGGKVKRGEYGVSPWMKMGSGGGGARILEERGERWDAGMFGGGSGSGAVGTPKEGRKRRLVSLSSP
jgi:hypothetical protein